MSHLVHRIFFIFSVIFSSILNSENFQNDLESTRVIHQISLDDIEQTASIFYEGFTCAYGHFASEEIGIQGDIKEYVKPWFIDHCRYIKTCKNPIYCLVAKEDDEIVGYIVFEQLDMDGGKILYSIAVDPKKHRKGIGTQLFQSMIHYSPTKKVIVHTRKVNASAIAFYEKLGFVVNNDYVSRFYKERAYLMIGLELSVRDN